MPAQYLKYKVKSLVGEADGIYTLNLEPVDGEVPKYEAGQFFMLKNTNLAADIKPKIKPYSALHPWRAGELSFGVKVHAQFSTALCSLKEGQEIECSGPYGFFTYANGDCPAVFIAGGIGITPLLTMIENLAAPSHAGKYYLIYSNRGEKDVAYRGLLDRLASENLNFKLVYAMTGEGECGFECQRRRISIDMLKEQVLEFDSAHFYMCASAGFLEAMEKALIDAGVSKERVHVEKW
ncbi:MAG: FAD-dependent oxidoreductase [Candidatus Micrarchaeota archaeon]